MLPNVVYLKSRESGSVAIRWSNRASGPEVTHFGGLRRAGRPVPSSTASNSPIDNPLTESATAGCVGMLTVIACSSLTMLDRASVPISVDVVVLRKEDSGTLKEKNIVQHRVEKSDQMPTLGTISKGGGAFKIDQICSYETRERLLSNITP